MRSQPTLRVSTALATALLASLIGSAKAEVSAEQAARLKTDLTPFGAEKAGNKDGSIPAWNGGYTTPIPGDTPGGLRGDPFKSEKPLFSITAKNADKYADKLTDGVKAMLAKYPGSFRVDVYPTHRTAAAPKRVYDETFKNATRAKLAGDLVEGAYGGIPFPIPSNGQEVIWNHILRWRGESWKFKVASYQLTASGEAVLASAATADQQQPYYLPGGTPEEFAKRNEYWMVRLITNAPPLRAGEAIVGREQIDGSRAQAWVYLTGQRRVRKLPNPCCDTPAPAAAGVMSFDELETFTGRLDRFDWKLLGKREMIVPYNGNKLMQANAPTDVLSPHHVNPDYFRWELHRVWVVEATLRAGARHQAPRNRYYCDEDTWTCVLGDRWDSNGKLWRTLWTQTLVAPDLPGTVTQTFGMYDLLGSNGMVMNIFAGQPFHYALVPTYSDSVFTPDAMAGEGVR